jgi:protein SCO1/2
MKPEAPGERQLLDWKFFAAAFVIGAVSLTAIRPLLRRVPEPPPVLGQVPAFELTAADGKPFGSRELAGRVYVVNFFFTQCPSICPALMQSMAELAKQLDARKIEGIDLVSISVDPDQDTPERLSEYGARIGAAAPRWHLLTGDRAAIVDLAEHGLKVPAGEKPAAEANPYEIAHTGKFVLVDARGRIRGYYERSAQWGMDEVFERARQVSAEPRT